MLLQKSVECPSAVDSLGEIWAPSTSCFGFKHSRVFEDCLTKRRLHKGPRQLNSILQKEIEITQATLPNKTKQETRKRDSGNDVDPLTFLSMQCKMACERMGSHYIPGGDGPSEWGLGRAKNVQWKETP